MTSGNSDGYVYAGAESHGLYRLVPGSDRWETLTGGLPQRVEVPGIALHPNDPQVVYVSLGAAARSAQETVFRGRDLFRTFEAVSSDVTAQSTMMAVRVNPRQLGHVFCVARDGEAFGSTDDGATWTMYPLPEEAKEVRGLAIG